MINLDQQIRNLRNEHMLSKSAGQSRESIADCQNIHERFKDVADNLRVLVENSAVLKALPEDAPEIMELSADLKNQRNKAIASLNAFISIWSQKKSAARQDDSLDNAQVSLEKLTLQLKEKVLSCWQSWISKLDSLSRVEQIMLDSQRGIPSIDKIYREYVDVRKNFLAAAKQIPDTVWKIQELNTMSVRMRELRDQMDFDLPPDVTRFFNQLNQPGSLGQAPLSLMTHETFQWLQKHDLLGHFAVSRKTF